MVTRRQINGPLRSGSPMQHVTFVRHLARYVAMGVASNATIYCLYLLVTYWGVGPKVAMSSLYFLGVLVGFIGHRNWTFGHVGEYIGTAFCYALAHFFGYLLNLLMLLILVDHLGFSHQWVQAAAAIVVAAFLFAAFKYFVFRENRAYRNS